MTETKYLSNKELVEELSNINNPTWTPEEAKRKEDLKLEVLRRLEEPWRKIKDE